MSTVHRSAGSLLPLMMTCLALAPMFAQLAEETFQFQFHKLADGVYASIRKEPVGLGVEANNLFVVDDDGVVVVDTNFGPSSTRQVLAALRKITDEPVKYVINTHPHDDHVLGNAVYRRRSRMPSSSVTHMASLFTSVTAQVKTAADAGQSLEQVRTSVNLEEFRQKFAGDSQLKRFLFANYVAGPAVTSAFRSARQAK